MCLKRICTYCGSEFSVQSKYSKRKMCSIECKFRSILPSEFSKTECFDWPKSINVQTGYGQFNASISRPVKLVSTHRMSYLVFVGEIPDGLCVCHTCDNRACINPNHLFLGTPKDNCQDMWSKGRQQDYKNMPKGYNNPARKHPERMARGERCHSSKLTESDIIEILSSPLKGAHIAKKFNVSQSLISSIRKRQVWRHVNPTDLQDHRR